MKTNYIPFMALIALFLLFSCKKKELSFTLEGKVIDQTFNTTLSGAKVSLEEVLEIGSNDDLVHESKVASDGTFSLEFKRRKATKYILRIEKENYFTIYKEIPFSDFSTEEALNLTLSTTAKAWVKLTFINEPPAAGTDSFRFIKIKGKSGCDECCADEEQILYGTETQQFIFENDGNAYFSYQYFQVAPVENGFREIVTPAFDTVEIVKYW